MRGLPGRMAPDSSLRSPCLRVSFAILIVSFFVSSQVSRPLWCPGLSSKLSDSDRFALWLLRLAHFRDEFLYIRALSDIP